MARFINAKELSQRINIVALAEDLGVKVIKNRARCISHSENHPSMHFDTRTNRVKCFGCDFSGDVIDFYMQCRSKSFNDALLELAEFYAPDLITNIISSSEEPKISNRIETNVQAGNIESFHEVYKVMKELCGNIDMKSLDYLMGPERGLSVSSIARHGIFHIPNRDKYNEVLTELKRKFGREKIDRSGINSFYRFAYEDVPFVIVPFFVGTKIEYLWARRIDGVPENKSLNLKGRRVPIFNLNILKNKKAGDKLYVCEGVFDAMIAEQEGNPAVAILGVGCCRPVLLNQIKDYDIHLCLDNDLPGKNAVKKVYNYYKEKHNKIIKAKKLPDGVKDITDYYLTHKNKQLYE